MAFENCLEVSEVSEVSCRFPKPVNDATRVCLPCCFQIINSYYSNLVNIVYSFGGDIIKIAGDALYCVFMPDEHDLRGAVLCAALCSMQLREVR